MIQLGTPTTVERLLKEIDAAVVGGNAGFAAWDKFHAQSLDLGHGWAMYVARSEEEAREALVGKCWYEPRRLEVVPQAWTPGWSARVDRLQAEGHNPLLPYGWTVPQQGDRLARVTGTGKTVWGVRPDGSLVMVTCRPYREDAGLTVPVQVEVEHLDGTWTVEAVASEVQHSFWEEPVDTGQPEECWVVSGRRGREPGDWRVRAHRRLRLPGYHVARARHLRLPQEATAKAIAAKREVEEARRHEKSMSELIDSLRR